MPLLIVLLILTAPGVLHAQVYKCPSADGSTAFSDQPCSEDAEVINNLDGTFKELTVYFAVRNQPHIRSIRF